jgi:hypothetical protein
VTLRGASVEPRRSVLEYAQALRSRYFRASKGEKGKMLDEFTKVTGLHRKAAIRLLRRLGQPRMGQRRGRLRQYGSGAAAALRVVWEASDRLCSKRLQPFLPEMVKVLRQHGEQIIDAAMESQLCRMSPSTIDRRLRPYRKGRAKGADHHQAGECTQELDTHQNLCRLAGEQAWFPGSRPGGPLR